MERIEALQIPNLTVEQMITADSAVDSKFHYSRGIWWREVKPFFYQPAAMLQSVVRGNSLPKRFLALGGYYHVVPSWSMANGQIVVSQIADVAQYDLGRLSKQARYEIRRGLTRLRIDRVTSLDELLGDGYNIYVKWEKRIRNAWVKRSDPKVFKKWIAGVLRHPGSLVLGAYDRNRLVAYVIMRGVEGVAELAKSFTDPEYYPISPSSALFYAYIEMCRRNAQIRIVCGGLRSTNKTLESYKHKLGFEHVCHPAYIYLRPILRPLVQRLMPEQYSRLTGSL